MIGSFRALLMRLLSRRRLRRKGLVSPRRPWIDWLEVGALLDRSPAPGIFSLVMVWSVATVLLTLASQQQFNQAWRLVVGQQVPRTIVANFDFSYDDAARTEQLRQETRNAQPSIYRVDSERAPQIRSNFTLFFEAVDRRIKDEAEKRKFQPAPNSLPDRLVAELPPEELVMLGSFYHTDVAFGQFMRELNVMIDHGIIGRSEKEAQKVGQTLRVIDAEGRVGSVRSITEQADAQRVAVLLAQIIRQHYSPGGGVQGLRDMLVKWVVPLVGEEGNIRFDQQETGKRQEAAAAEVDPVKVVKTKGDLLVQRDQTVTAEVRDMLLAYMQAERENSRVDREWKSFFGNMIWSMLFVMFAGFYLYHLHPEVVNANKRITLVALVVIIGLLANYGGMRFFGFILSESTNLSQEMVLNALPIALTSVILAVIFGFRVALCAGFFVSSVAAMMVVPERAFDLAIKGMMICSLSALAVRSATNYRSYFIRVIGTVFPLVWVLNANLLDPSSPEFLSQLAQSASLALANAFATAILSLVLIFLFEIVFNISTNMALMVLCDYNHPLLERMKREAPGTFFHSLMVATLVEDAARAIGANPLKAKAGALFHDIGKLSMPQYFTENNIDTANQHIDLNPQMSSLIIRDHVKEGLALARKYRLCRTIRDAIDQHHGDGLVQFFYNKALEESRKNGAPVLESQFRYTGKPPQDKEMAIISLADACEAASRSLDKPSAAKIEALVSDIFRQRYRDGQLNEANITLADLDKVRQSFVNTLISMKHGRIAYQKESPANGQRELQMGNQTASTSAEK